ncbi:hypothetical protein [Mucilaginibacter celer]|uniref:Uncharacterized protein n=1 Tax=Mucilaginibacter celer TaxID=2305508 RepID=A0A494W106_9SPHI|nr:hypothetical protein [Mucilaginibacter celer]AYL97185.1 hypothetical protein HYN43_018555 [Mucilaginibacter celer]
MIKKHEILHTLLYDGTEEGMLDKTFSLPYNQVKYDDFADNNFEELANVAGAEDFKSITETAGFETDGGFLNLYQGSDRLRLYYAKKDNMIYVFAFGEFQPMRYKIYLEGVWELEG